MIGIPSVLPRIWAIGLGIALVVVSGVALKDGIEHRATIRALEGDKTDLQSRLGAEQRNVGTCHANVATLDDSLKMQGADIRKLSDDTVAAAKRADDRAKAGAAVTAAVRATVDAIAKRAPPAPAEACSASVDLLRGAM